MCAYYKLIEVVIIVRYEFVINKFAESFTITQVVFSEFEKLLW